MLEIICDNKDGNVFLLNVSSINLEYSRSGSPGKLTLKIPPAGMNSSDFDIAMGATIMFRITPDQYNFNNSGYNKNFNIFFGYVFSKDRAQNGDFSIVAYDQLKYLLNKDTYNFPKIKLNDMIAQIANDFSINLGELEDTKYYLAGKVHDNSSLLDMINWGVNETFLATGEYFMIYDNFGKLTLSNVKNLTTDLLIGDTSGLQSLTYKESIDSDTYNLIKLEKDNKDTGFREIFVAKDAGNQGFWGTLQYFEKVDESLTESQIIEKCNVLLKAKNKPSRTCSLESIGIPGLIAGQYIFVYNSKLKINGFFNITKITHKWDKSFHQMSLEVLMP